MAEPLQGNALLTQSGRPTAVVNASACGVVHEALRHPCIGDLYGANDGLLGIVHEDLFDLRAEMLDAVDGLRTTPASALGSGRYRLGDPAVDRDRYARILDVFRAHGIRYGFFLGGTDTMAAADGLRRLADEAGYELRLVGVPKSAENDLAGTDHSPGFGSAARYLATSVMEAGRDAEAMYTFEAVTVVETMGQSAGWLAAAAGLARRHEDDAPHLIYVPEVPFSAERFLTDVQEVHRRLGRAFVVAAEGLVDDRGEPVAGPGGRLGRDNPRPGGVAEHLQRLVAQEIGLQCRYNKPGTFQRAAGHWASATDSAEAYRCGQEAVRRGVAGASGCMVTLVREEDRPYRCGLGVVPLAEAAAGARRLPRDFLDVAGTQVTEAMRQYAAPLLGGAAPLRLAEDGLPEFARLHRRPVPRKLAAFVGKSKG